MGSYEPGKKGYIFLSVVLFFIMFFILWAYVYSMNGESLPQ